MHQENALIATHLRIPGYALRPMPIARKRTASVLQDTRILRRVMPGIPKDIAIGHSHQAKLNRAACHIFACRHRDKALADYGGAPGPNSTPVSGGTCDHWPREVQDLVVAYERAAGAWYDLAVAWHRYAGKRRHTFSPSTL